MFYRFQQGSVLYVTVMLLAVLMALAISLSVVLVSELKMARSLEHSVVALFAAQTGLERGSAEFGCPEALPSYTKYLDTEQEIAYEVEFVACNSSYPFCEYIFSNFDCDGEASVRGPFPENEECIGQSFCIFSTGIYKDTRRRIKTAF